MNLDGREFVQLMAKSVWVGYSIPCSHSHTDRGSKFPCIKSCTFGRSFELSPVEVRRRLLAWDAAGQHLEPMPGARDAHVGMGGVLLKHFA